MGSVIQQTFMIDGLDDVWFTWDDDPQFLDDGYKFSVWAEVVDRHFCVGQGVTLEAATKVALMDMARKLGAMQRAVLDEYVKRLQS